MPDSKYSSSRRQFLSVLQILLGLSLTPRVLAEGVRVSNKWRIEFSEAANSGGVITFLVTPEVGHGQVVKSAIPDDTSENHVARLVRDAFREQLLKEHYHIEVDDGEDILIKSRHGSPDFALELISSNVKSVRIHLQRE